MTALLEIRNLRLSVKTDEGDGCSSFVGPTPTN